MIIESNHICVCISTFKRPDLLKRLLNVLSRQITEERFSYSIVIADNDHKQSAKEVVSAFAAASSIEITYCVEPEQNIALARNMALANSKGNFIALIDDDEIPEKDWLYFLFQTLNNGNVDGVLGPVRPYFEHKPPQWATRGKFFDRPEHATGHKMNWSETRSGNVLIKKEIINGIEHPFRAEFGTGSEDVDFFRRMIGKGKVFIWCNEAPVYELVPPVRCTRGYQIKKALLRGGNSLKYEDQRRACNIIRSFVAIPIYSFSLPFLFLMGDHLFMKYLTKLCDHTGRILKLLDINPIKERGK